MWLRLEQLAAQYRSGTLQIRATIKEVTLSRFAFPILLLIRQPLFGKPKRDPILDNPPTC